MILKLKLEGENEGEYIDYWTRTEFIQGFCITQPREDETLEVGERVNLFISGHTFTVKNEKHLQDFLMENFVDAAVKNED